MQILSRRDGPCDRIKELLDSCLLRPIAYFYKEFCGRVLDHYGEQLVLWSVMVVVWEVDEGEDLGVEMKSLRE